MASVPGGSVTPFLESDPVLGDVDSHFSGDYLNQETVMRAERAAGMSTATIGKLGPALIFDHTERSGEQTIVIDDQTGRPGAIPLSEEMRKRLTAAGLALVAPTRGENGKAGDFQTPGTLEPNTLQQDYFVGAATKAVLPLPTGPPMPRRSARPPWWAASSAPTPAVSPPGCWSAWR